MRSRVCRRVSVTVLLQVLVLFAFGTGNALAQNEPIPGQYPGGHVGIRGAATPPPGLKELAMFARFQNTYALKDDSGNTIEDESNGYFANIWAFVYSSKIKLLGGHWGGMVAIPFTDSVVRPTTEFNSTESTSFGLSDSVVLPFMIFYEWKQFDFQWGIGAILPTGPYNPDSSVNRGAGYPGILGSVGGVWYPKGNRRSWSVSAVARLEFNGEQEDTDIDVGDDVVIDWGVGKLFITGKKNKVAFDVGINGFLEWQVTSQSGPLPTDSAPKYQVFGIGPSLNIDVPKWNLGFLIRPNFEFGAKNTSQANNLWLNVSYHWGIGKKKTVSRP